MNSAEAMGALISGEKASAAGEATAYDADGGVAGRDRTPESNTCCPQSEGPHSPSHKQHVAPRFFMPHPPNKVSACIMYEAGRLGKSVSAHCEDYFLARDRARRKADRAGHAAFRCQLAPWNPNSHLGRTRRRRPLQILCPHGTTTKVCPRCFANTTFYPAGRLQA